MNTISNLRKQPELSALNNGAAVALPVGNTEKLHAILRYDDQNVYIFLQEDHFLTHHELKY